MKMKHGIKTHFVNRNAKLVIKEWETICKAVAYAAKHSTDNRMVDVFQNNDLKFIYRSGKAAWSNGI